MVNFKRLSLTDLKVKIGLNAGHKALVAAWTKADILNKWNSSSWGVRLAKRAAKSSATDFDRFAAMVAKKKVRMGDGRGLSALPIGSGFTQEPRRWVGGCQCCGLAPTGCSHTLIVIVMAIVTCLCLCVAPCGAFPCGDHLVDAHSSP